MPLPTIAGTVRCSFRGLMPSGRQWANVVHCRYAQGASTPGPTEIATLDALLVRLWWGAVFGAGAPWSTYLQTSTTLIDATYYPLDGLSIPQVIAHPLSGGGGAGATLPSEVAAVVTTRSNVRGRRFRGRTYLPAPIVSAVQTNGTWATSVVTATLAQWNGLRTALGGHAGPPVAPFWEIGVASYITQSTVNGVPTGPTLTPVFTPAASFTMDAKPDVQRRRK